MSDPAPRPRRFVRWVLAVLALAAAGSLAVWVVPSFWSSFVRPEALRDWIRSWGPWAPVAFLLVQVLQVVVFALPGEITQVAGGWLFGFAWGSVLSVAGILLGSAVAFGLARVLGVRFVHRIAGPRSVTRFDTLMASPKLVGSVFLLFLIPGIPKDIVCYVAGLSRLKFWPFLAISGIARLPGILGSSLIGKAALDQNWVLLALVAGSAALLFAIGWKFRTPIFTFLERFAVQPTPKERTP
jgi:uncharacterized membrane protein YdjX (TVP38/TMEM64 family)